MGRASRAAEQYIAVLERVGDTLDDVLSREIFATQQGRTIDLTPQRRTLTTGDGGYSGERTAGSDRTFVEHRRREPGTSGDSPMKRYGDYIRQLQAQGFRGRDIPSYQEWLRAGAPGVPEGGFGYGGSVNPPTGFGYGTGASPFPGSPHFTGGRSVTGASASTPTHTNDAAAVAELRGLRADLRRNGGIL